jgi:hypothetical protein
MSDSGSAGIPRVVEHQHGELLRLQTSGIYATEAAKDLLGFLESELEGEIADPSWNRGSGPNAAEPVLILLDALQVQLSTDGSDVVIRRVGGSKDEFDDLCDLIGDQANHE